MKSIKNIGIIAAVAIVAAAIMWAKQFKKTGSAKAKSPVAAAVVAVLGSIGAPADRPWIEHATVAPGARKITPDLLVTAFAAAGLCSIEGDKPGPLRFLSPIAHDGPGVRATIELPAGKTADQNLTFSADIPEAHFEGQTHRQRADDQRDHQADGHAPGFGIA